MTGSREGTAPRVPRLHIVTDDAVLDIDRFRQLVESLLHTGGERVSLQLRARAVTGRTLLGHAEFCVGVARRTGSLLLVNDRVDVALACGAHGVQLGRASFTVADARELIGPDMLIGASVHDESHADTAAKEGADFLVAGTLYPSGSHPGRPAAGVDWLTALSALRIPLIGIGGIEPGRVPEVLRAGAHGVAVIRGIWGASSPVAAMREYLSAME